MASNAIKYVGPKMDWKGRRLFDLICNLKNYGVGRIVVKSEYEKMYPELSYYTIVKAEPDMDKYNNYGNVWVKQVFRGYEIPEVVLCQETDHADFRLIPKDEEHIYTKAKHVLPPEIIMPRQDEFPPLLKHLLEQKRVREAKKAGIPVDKTPLKLDLIYKETTEPWRIRVQKEGERANVEWHSYPADAAFYKRLSVPYERKPHMPDFSGE